MKYIVVLMMALAIVACTSSVNAEQETAKPTNIIFLIGDGMGLSAVSTTLYYGDEVSEFKQFKEIGLIRTSSAIHKVTDSAASSTAMSSGKKTYNGAIGVDTTKTSIPNIAELVAGLGWNTGVIASSTISHATPASFYAHIDSRSKEQEIIAQLLESEIDFFAGGGIAHFNKRTDGADLFKTAKEHGFIMDTTSLALPGTLQAGQKYGFLLAAGAMPPMTKGRGDFLPDATNLAMAQLSQEEKGFFLMVEGSQIDWGGHANNTEYVVTETLDFEKTVAAALDFARKDGNTLVVVTADHETGGFTLSALKNEETGSSDYNKIGPTFATGGHSATLIPVFAYGPGAENFKGIYENTEIFHKMMALVKGE
jgi:alkaline phosphatase